MPIGNSYDEGQERGLRNALGFNIVHSPDMNLKSVIDEIKRCLYNALKEAAAPAASHYIRKQIPRTDKLTIRAA
jgi:hypothetical protein